MKKLLLFFTTVILITALIIGVYVFSSKPDEQQNDIVVDMPENLQELIDRNENLKVYSDLGFEPTTLSDVPEHIEKEFSEAAVKKTFSANVFLSSRETNSKDTVYWFTYTPPGDHNSHLFSTYVAIETKDSLYLLDYKSEYSTYDEISVCDITGDGIDDILIVQNELNDRGYRCRLIRSNGNNLEILLDTYDESQEYYPFVYTAGDVKNFGFTTKTVNDYKVEIANEFTDKKLYIDMKGKHGAENFYNEDGTAKSHGGFYVSKSITECVPADLNNDGIYELKCRSYIGDGYKTDVCYVSYTLRYNPSDGQLEAIDFDAEEIIYKPDAYEKISVESLVRDNGVLDRIYYKADRSIRNYEITLSGLCTPTTIRTQDLKILSVSTFEKTIDFSIEDDFYLYGNTSSSIISAENSVLVYKGNQFVGDTYIITEHGIEEIHPEGKTCITLSVNENGELRYTRCATKFSVTHSGALGYATSYDDFYYEEGSAHITDGKLTLSAPDTTYNISDKFNLDAEFDTYKQMWANSDCHSIEDVFEYNKNRGY